MQRRKKVPLWKRGKEVHLGHGKGLRKVLWTEKRSGMGILRKEEENLHKVRRVRGQFREF